MRQQIRGFTLIELMITLVILVILVTLAIPTFAKLIADQRVTSQTNQLLAAVRGARSEAIRRGSKVEIDPDGDFSDGFTVKESVSGDVIRRFDEFGADMDFDDGSSGSAPGKDDLEFDDDGSLDASVTIGIEPSGSCSGDKRRVITLLASGQARTNTGSCS